MPSDLDPEQQRRRDTRRAQLHAAALRAEASRARLAHRETCRRYRYSRLLALLGLEDAHRHLRQAQGSRDPGTG